MKADFIINPDDKFYFQANDWMWDYCTFLGKFTNSVGENFDLGVYLGGTLGPSEACVYGNIPGDYYSGNLSDLDWQKEQAARVDTDPRYTIYLERKIECYRRAKLLNLF